MSGSTGASSPRLAALDIGKGLFVLTMVFYHSLNYSSEYFLAFRYMSFLPPSFIFITGYLVIALYPARYAENRRKMYIRLIGRGVRLVLIFTLLNLGGLALVKRLHPLDVLAIMRDNAFDIFVIGSGRSAIFEVLLPIGYFLVLSPVVLALHAWGRWPLLLAAVLGVAGTLVLNRSGYSPENLNLLMAGVLGAATAPFVGLGQLAGGRVRLVALGVAFVAYELVGLKWGHVFEVQLLGATLAVFFALAVGQCVLVQPWVVRRVVVLGQYSLLAYILQIAILQVILRIVGRPAPWSLPFYFWMAVTTVLMTLAIEATVRLRRSSPVSDRLYRAVFA